MPDRDPIKEPKAGDVWVGEGGDVRRVTGVRLDGEGGIASVRYLVGFRGKGRLELYRNFMNWAMKAELGKKAE